MKGLNITPETHLHGKAGESQPIVDDFLVELEEEEQEEREASPDPGFVRAGMLEGVVRIKEHKGRELRKEPKPGYVYNISPQGLGERYLGRVRGRVPAIDISEPQERSVIV